MGTLLQMMALPAAWMLVAWMRGGSAQAVAALLQSAVALIARLDAVWARRAASAVKVSAVEPSAPAPATQVRAAWPKLAHAAVSNAFAIVGTASRVQRSRRVLPLRAGASRAAA